ncbi:MAG: peptide ABC transporter substrate-binding protein [Bacillota bacterium]
MLKKIILASLVVVFTLGAAAGCAPQKPAEQPKPAETPAPPPPAKKEMVLTVNIGTEPQHTDPNKATGVPDNTLTLHCFEGLTRLNGNEVIPGVAEKWEITENATKYVFTLRQNAKWSNGDPVTANDFVFSWKRALDPATKSEYAYQLYYVKGAEAFNTGAAKTADGVGVKAVDAHTLEVTLEAPCHYFLYMTAFPTYYPLNEKVVKADNEGWSTKPETYVGNGPMKLVKWDHKSKFELVPNENYWGRANVKLDKLVLTMVEELSTELTMFEAGQLDVTNDVAESEIPRVRTTPHWHPVPNLGTYYYLFSVTKKPVDNLKVRQALTLAIDRKTIVEKILNNAGFIPAMAWVPPGYADASNGGKDFRDKTPGYFAEYDPDAAKKLLSEAGYPDGKGFPKIEIIYNTNDRHKKIAEAIQAMWKKNLNIDVTLANQEWGVYLDNRTKLNYQVARAGWIADYYDPMTFIDMWTSTSGNNDTGWKSRKFDDIISRAKKTADNAERFKLMHEAEDLMMAEQIVCPIYYYVEPKMVRNTLKGARWSSLSLHDYAFATIEK